MRVEGHALLPPPSLEEIEAEARRAGVRAEEATRRLLAMRAAFMRAERADPLRCGWEPAIWQVGKALLDWPWCSSAVARRIEGRFGFGWDEFKARMRRRLGFERAVTMLLVLGGNRTSKSNFAAKLGQEMATNLDRANVYAFHMSNPRSVAEQQPLFWHYMPPEWKRQTMSDVEYVKFRQKTGFAEGSFINARGSMVGFLNYMQDRDTALEGMEANLLLPDELVPADWVTTMLYRLSTRAGRGVVTFTPIHGYSATVKMFCDGGQVVRLCTGFMLPRDGGDALPGHALGLGEAEWRELLAAEDRKGNPPARCAQSRPEDCLAWLEEPGAEPVAGRGGDDGVWREFGWGKSFVEPPAGRTFEDVPRVMRCHDPRLAVVWFHACDNPYGNPKEVMQSARTQGVSQVRMRVYGKAERTLSPVFVRFRREVHVVRAGEIPGMRPSFAGGGGAAGATEGRAASGGAEEQFCDWMFVDPHPNRNWFALWVRATREHDYVIREWPGSYWIPGEGVPGPWAEASGKKDGRNDGERGEGQESFGWGLSRYTFEWARLEEWEDWRRWAEGRGSARELRDAVARLEDTERWDDLHGARWPVEGRFVDSRAASEPRVERDRQVTLYEDLQEWGMDWDLAPGGDVIDGVQRIQTALEWEEAEDGKPGRAPRLLVSEECRNTIFALETWMNAEKDRGACKEPIDCLRWFYTAECGWRRRRLAPRGGTFYGAGVGRPARRRVGRAWRE